MLRVTLPPFVMAVPEADHAPSPSSFPARTCTS